MRKDLVLSIKFWKIIANIWTLVAVIIFLLEFFSRGAFNASVTSIGIIYITILGIFATVKEYERWKKEWHSKYLGEVFIILWTVIFVIFVIVSSLSGGKYKVSSEMAAIYLSVLGIFAITNRSKALHKIKHK